MECGHVIIFVNNNIYKLNKQPFESDTNAYIRLWWLINNNKSLDSIEDISLSIIELNKRSGMSYLT